MKIALTLAMGLVFSAHSLFAGRNDVMEGNPASPVKVVIYEDLQCADCARFQAILEQKILPKYGSRVAFIHRDFPLGKHDWAWQAAVASRWVFQQSTEMGIQIRREILSEQDNITSRNLRTWLTDFAARNRLDEKDLLAALNDPRINALVDQDRQAAAARGVTKTPTVYVGGVAFADLIDYEDVARALDEALAK